MLRQFVWSLLVVVLSVRGAAAQTVFPGDDWETVTPASQGVDAAGLEKAKAWLESHNSKSGVVIRHGRIVAEWYFGDANRQSKFAAYSTSKSLSSMATGLAIADGKLALDHTVGKYVADAAPAGKKSVTVKQLLSMTSGVHNDPNVPQREDLFTYAVKMAPMDHQPGAKWDYNNTGLALAQPGVSQSHRPADRRLPQRASLPSHRHSLGRSDLGAAAKNSRSRTPVATRRPARSAESDYWCGITANGTTSKSSRPHGSANPSPRHRSSTSPTATCGGTTRRTSGPTCQRMRSRARQVGQQHFRGSQPRPDRHPPI